MSSKQQLRRTLLYVPGNSPSMLQSAHIYGSDCLVFDLEDAVSVAEKDAARQLVYNALTCLDFGSCEMIVRINDYTTDVGQQDIIQMVKTQKAVLRLPKVDSAADIQACDALICRAEEACGAPKGSTRIMASLETALGVLNAREIACASPRLLAISLGAEDFVTNLKTTRSASGIELLLARSNIVLAARAAGINAIDTAYTDVNNDEGFLEETMLIKQLGFDGKSVINPKQIAPVHSVFTPTQTEVEHSLDILEAILQANQRGSGVASLNGKMIDKPIVTRAQHLLQLAEASGILKEGRYHE